jgi:plastocyanin
MRYLTQALATALVAWTCTSMLAEANNTLTGTITVTAETGKRLSDAAGVIVFIEGVPRTSAKAAARAPLAISQKGQAFTPRVLPVVAGAEVAFLNDDGIYHNVFSLSRAMPFDLGVLPRGTSKKVRFDKRALVAVHCNLHPNMVSYIVVLPTEHFSQVDANGSYRIADIPDGTYRIRLWDEWSDEQSITLTFSGDQVLQKNFGIARTRRAMPHTNKFGRQYRDKY